MVTGICFIFGYIVLLHPCFVGSHLRNRSCDRVYYRKEGRCFDRIRYVAVRANGNGVLICRLHGRAPRAVVREFPRARFSTIEPLTKIRPRVFWIAYELPRQEAQTDSDVISRGEGSAKISAQCQLVGAACQKGEDDETSRMFGGYAESGTGNITHRSRGCESRTWTRARRRSHLPCGRSRRTGSR